MEYSNLKIEIVKKSPHQNFEDRDGYPAVQSILKMNNIIYVISENHESYATQSSSGISHDYYRKKGILFDKFSPQGEYLGAHTIKRKAYGSEVSTFTDILVIHNDEPIELLYNADSKFLNGLKSGKSSKLLFPIKNNMIIKSVLNAGTEQLDTKAVSTSGSMHINGNCFEIIDGTRYIVGFDGRFKKLRLGGGGVTTIQTYHH